MKQNPTIFSLIVFVALVANLAQAQSPRATGSTPNAPQNPALKAERISVDTIKEKYWAKGDENELRVVQNRLYSKAGKLELGAFYGGSTSDPFVSTSQIGGSLGYYFSEYISLEAFAWKAFASESSAGADLRTQTKAASNGGSEVAPNINKQESFVGGQLRFSPLYGKLSLVGKSIIYFDLFAVTGAGMMKTENGNYVAPFVGLGQQVYLSRSIALRLDYRFMYYNERILSRNTATYGRFLTDRSNFTSSINVGLTLFLDLFG